MAGQKAGEKLKSAGNQLDLSSRASSIVKNQLTFKHSSRNAPLNDSIFALSIGLSGLEKSIVTPFS